MSDAYVALVDGSATPEEAPQLAALAIEALSSAGLIVPLLSPDCVLGDSGYPAGPRCAEVYRAGRSYEFWTLVTSGVEVVAKPWVNFWGFPLFSGATCPHCGHAGGDEFLHEVSELAETYESTGVVPRVQCASCNSAAALHQWSCNPHLGFVNFALVFWNWPPFDGSKWQINVRALLEERLERPLATTFGRV